MNKNLETAAKIIRGGGVVIFPTDTAFGIGCRIDNAQAVEKLFKIRRRAREKAVPVLVSSSRMARGYIKETDPDTISLMKKYWPGGLTIVSFGRKNKVPQLVRGGGSTVGVRAPKHKTALELIRRVGVPILGPSANFSGGTTPFKLTDLDPVLVRLVDFVLPGRCSRSRRPSTVLDVSVKPWRILREGAVRLRIKN